MKKFMKPVSVMLLTGVMLTACGNAEEENEAGNVNEEADNTTNNENINEAEDPEEENENNSIEMNEEDDNNNNTNINDENENENNNAAMNEEEENETDNNHNENTEEEETGSEVEYDPADDGEEREAETAEGENYMYGGTFTGGEVTDGRSVGHIDHGMHDGYERLVLDIYEGSYQELEDPAEIPNHFEVTKEAYPARFVYTLSGIRGLPEDIPDLSGMEYFTFMDTIPLFDDATIQLAAYVQHPVEFEVFEMHDPAKIVTDVRPREEEEEYAAVYSLRTASVSGDENMEDIEIRGTALTERDAEEVRTLHGEDDTLLVEEGYYHTQEEAEDRKAELEEDLDFELHVEERGMYDVPGNIE